MVWHACHYQEMLALTTVVLGRFRDCSSLRAGALGGKVSTVTTTMATTVVLPLSFAQVVRQYWRNKSIEQQEATVKIIGRLFILGFVLALAGCSVGGGAFVGGLKGNGSSVDVTQLPSMRVVGLDITVPRSLTVSEADSYKPVADIVWREDPFGDRYEQVKAIFEEGIGQGARSLQGDLPVVLHIELRRFHALTERTRYSIGGMHEIAFMLSVTNGRTGDVIIPPYLVRSSFVAYGGAKALAAERVGLTQKVRITRHLAALIRQELTGIPAEPAVEPDLGL